jgi:hypothetical protein
MAHIKYCDDQEIIDGWHPIYEGVCDDPRLKDEWFAIGVYRSDEFVIEVFAEDDEEKQFKRLADRWKSSTALYGNLSKIVMDEDYQRIMAMGPRVIPYILRDLATRPAHWFWALRNLVPEGQDPAEGLTTIEEARQAWLKWGLENDKL